MLLQGFKHPHCFWCTVFSSKILTGACVKNVMLILTSRCLRVAVGSSKDKDVLFSITSEIADASISHMLFSVPLKSIFYVAWNVFRYLNVGVKAMKCFYCFWHCLSSQTVATVPYASCLFKHLEIRGGSWLTLVQSDIFHYISYQWKSGQHFHSQTEGTFWSPTINVIAKSRSFGVFTCMALFYMIYLIFIYNILEF